MNDKYILDGQTPIVEPDLMKWVNWFETADRKVASTEIVTQNETIKISTVFLGLDHSYGTGEPLLFETMVFGGEFDGEMTMYPTWDEAEKGHKKMVKRVK